MPAKVLYEMPIRHRQLELCLIGALGFYLLTRFEVSKEIEDIRFDNKKAWFNRILFYLVRLLPWDWASGLGSFHLYIISRNQRHFFPSRIINQTLSLRFVGTNPMVFKPGMPFEAQITVRYHDQVSLAVYAL